jgi:hypothetical protein
MKRTLSLFVLGLVLIAPTVRAQGCPPPTNIPVGNCAPREGTPSNFSGDEGPMRVRKSIFALSAAEITRLKLAFERLRALPASDPRTWMAQAKVHCWYCAGGGSTVPDVHANWAFLHWHRDYLYVLEKTLGALVGDPSFALPYWDWNTTDNGTCTGHLRVPPPYLGGTANALVDCYRLIGPTSTMDVTRVGAAKVDSILTAYNTFPLFFGSPTNTSILSPGPHGYVHLFVGNPTTLRGTEDMGILATAARDPLFWAHHANIDRIWELWIARYGTPAYPGLFLSQNWTFWDQNQRLIRITADDAAKRDTRLKYRYDPPCAPAGVAGKAAAAKTWTLGTKTGSHVVVNLEELTVAGEQGGIFRVYVNRPATAAAGAAGKVLVDELFLVPNQPAGSGQAAHHHTVNVALVLPDDLASQVVAAKGQLSVTVVPVVLTLKGLLEGPPSAPQVKMKKPYFSVE